MYEDVQNASCRECQSRPLSKNYFLATMESLRVVIMTACFVSLVIFCRFVMEWFILCSSSVEIAVLKFTGYEHCI